METIYWRQRENYISEATILASEGCFIKFRTRFNLSVQPLFSLRLECAARRVGIPMEVEREVKLALAFGSCDAGTELSVGRSCMSSMAPDQGDLLG
jgi:hypothetical protein